MTERSLPGRPVAAVIALFLLLTACGASGTIGQPDPTSTTGQSNNDAVTASDCEADAPVCDDAIPSEDEPASGGASMGMTVNGGLSVSDALSTDATGVLAVQGFIVADANGAQLCELLAESFPPQCGGASIPISGYESTVDQPMTSEQGVTWTDQPVTLFGDIVDGTLVVDPTVSG